AEGTIVRPRAPVFRCASARAPMARRSRAGCRRVPNACRTASATRCDGSCEPSVQHPAIRAVRREKRPRALAFAGAYDVVIAAHVLAVPPAAFDAFGTGDDMARGSALPNRLTQQTQLMRLQTDD